MITKQCEACGVEFEAADGSRARTCSVACRNRLVAVERKAKHPQTHSCVICGKGFSFGSQDWAKKTCSPECGYKLRASKTSKGECRQCLTCGKDFYAKRSQIDGVDGGGSYCSKACLYERNKTATTRKCECCGKEFSTPPSHMHVKTCSTECGYKIRACPEKEKIRLTCKNCGKVFFDHESRAEKRIYCSIDCKDSDPELAARRSSATSNDKNPAWKGGVMVKTVSASGKPYSRSPRHIEDEKAARRNRAKAGATPAWANIEKMRSIYKTAKTLTDMTGVAYHVDHIVPLTSELVCGLHNEFNLQVMPGVENLKKHNRHWPDMP